MKQQIEQLLSTQKVNSISDIICLVIEQVNRTLSQQPMQQIHFRLSELQKPKGLDAIMIEEVKTIVEAMIDQRQQNIRFDVDRALNQNYENIDHLISNLNHTNKKNRPSLAQLDIINFFNTNSFNGGFQDDCKKTRESFKENFSQSLLRDNLSSDCNKLKQKMQNDKKQLTDLKYTIMQINRQISNKITIQEAEKIISEFQSKMYHKIQNQKLDIQKLQFKVKKQLQDEILKVRKQTFIDVNFQMIQKQIATAKRISEKIQKKFDKYKEQTKNLSKGAKNFENTLQKLKSQIQKNQKQFFHYCQFNDCKNEGLNEIFEGINKKLQLFDKINLLQQKLDSLALNNWRGIWLTQCKTKNQSIVWENQIYNPFPNSFKFQVQKTQIVINQTSIYQVEFTLLESKASHLSGSVFIQSLGLDLNRRQIKISGSNSLKAIIQINEKSSICIKLHGGQNNEGARGKGILKICKY